MCKVWDMEWWEGSLEESWVSDEGFWEFKNLEGRGGEGRNQGLSEEKVGVGFGFGCGVERV